MRKLTLSFISAIGLHLLIAVLFVKFSPKKDFSIQRMTLEIGSLPPDPVLKPQPAPSLELEKTTTLPNEPEIIESILTIEVDPKITLEKKRIQQLAKKQHFLQSSRELKTTSFEHRKARPLFDQHATKTFSDVAHPDGYRQVPILPALFQGLASLFAKSKKRPQFDFLPSDAQLQGMAEIYKKGGGTPLDIYPLIKTKNTITAELFDKELEQLVEKGFLSREKISPQNLFTIATPVGGVPVEMSRKNILNPVYHYKPLVYKNQLKAYLESQIFDLNEKMKTTADSLALTDKIHVLQKYLNLLPENGR